MDAPVGHAADVVRVRRAEQLVVAEHEFVGDRHELAVHVVGRVGDPHGVAQRLAHLLAAVDPVQDRRRQHDLRLLAEAALHVAADQQVEVLVRAAQFDVGAQRDRIVRLHQRVEELVHVNRHAVPKALREIVALQQARHGVVAAQADDIGRRQRVQPLRVEPQFGPVRVENLEDLPGVRLGVRPHLVARQRLARFRAAGRIADHGGEIADQKDDGVPDLLKLAQLVQDNRMSQVQILGRRVGAPLHPQRFPAAEFLDQLLPRDDRDGAALDFAELGCDGQRHERWRARRPSARTPWPATRG